MKKQKGFSLIELLIVVAIILIIAAIAIPNLLKSRMAANEASAVGSMRTYNTSFVAYSTQCPSIGFPADTAKLGGTAGDCTGAGLVDNILGQASPTTKSGYTFNYVPTASGGINAAYTLTGLPVNVGTTGQRGFFTDQSGVIRYNATGTAAPTNTDSPIS